MDRQPYIKDMETFSLDFLFRKLGDHLDEHQALLSASLDPKLIQRSQNTSHLKQNESNILSDHSKYGLKQED